MVYKCTLTKIIYGVNELKFSQDFKYFHNDSKVYEEV